MALDRLTKIDGGGISTTSDYRVGIITASKFVGPFDGTGGNFSGVITATNGVFSGNISAVDGNFSGNVTIGGTLTYEDVTNIDSVGIITAQKDIHVGAGVSAVGVGTFGSLDIGGDIDVDGHTNLDNVSVAGVTTFASSIYVADSIIHEGDTDTKIDLAPNQIKLTASNRLRIDFAANAYNYLYGTQLIEADSTNPKPGASTYVARFRDTTGDNTEVQFFNTNVTNTILAWNDYGNSTSAGNLVFKGVVGGSGLEHARFTGSGNFNLLRDLDVDGHTNLDNVSVAGVTTITGSGTALQVGGGTNPHSTKPTVNISPSSGNAMLTLRGESPTLYFDKTGSGHGKILTDAVNLSIYNGAIDNQGTEVVRIAGNGNVSVFKDLDVDGHTNLDNVSIAGVTTISYSGTSEYGLDVYNPTSGGSGARVRAGDNDGQYALLVENGAGTNLFEVLSGGGGARLRSGDLFILDKITHYGESNTHIRFPANDTISFETSGDERVRISSVGHLGVGDNNPDTRLSVKAASGTDVVGKFTSDDANAWIQFRDNTTTDTAVMVGANGNNLLFRAGSNTRWKIDSSGHFVPNSPGSYNIGSTSLEIGDIYLGVNKKVFCGINQELQLYTDGTDGYLKETNGDLYLQSTADDIIIRAADNISIQAQGGEYCINGNGNGSVDLYYDGGTYTTPKLSTTATGITVDGEVAASQDYPDFEPVLNFNFAGSSTQLDPRLLYRRSGVASFYDANGLVKLVGENTPRFDHDPISRKNKGILIEHSRTNLFPHGTTPGDLWSSSKSGTFEEYTTETTAPDGTFTATKWTFTNNDPYIYHAETLSANTTYTISMWVKAGTNMAGDRVQMRIGGAPYSSGDIEVIPADGTWKRISYTRTIGGSAENSANVGFEPQTSPSGNPASGDVIYIWGAQLEVGAYVSSFIPTYGRTQTRGADLLVIDGDDSTALSDAYNDQEGTLVVEYHNVTTDGSYVATIDDGSNNNRFGISNSNSSQGISVSGGTSQGQLDNGTPIVGATNKMAHAYKTNDRGLSINGNDATQDNGFALPTGIRFIWIGCRSGSYDFLGSTISRFMYYTKRLPNSQLKLLTSQ